MRRSGKVRENSPQKVRESQGTLSGHVSWNPVVHFLLLGFGSGFRLCLKTTFNKTLGPWSLYLITKKSPKTSKRKRKPMSYLIYFCISVSVLDAQKKNADEARLEIQKSCSWYEERLGLRVARVAGEKIWSTVTQSHSTMNMVKCSMVLL